MRFPVFILALIVSEVAYAQTPLPRHRPADAPSRAVAKTQDVSKSNAVIPMPRSRPADARRAEAMPPVVVTPAKNPMAESRSVESVVTTLPPETEVPVRPQTSVAAVPPPEPLAPVVQAAPPVRETPSVQTNPAGDVVTVVEAAPVSLSNPVPQESGVTEAAPLKAPATRFKPEVVIRRARAEAAAIEAAEAAEAAARKAERANEPEEVAADKQMQSSPDSVAVPLGNTDQDKSRDSAAAPAEATEEPAAKEETALPEQPPMQKRGAVPRVSSGATPVSPSEAAKLDRLDAQRKENGASSQRADGPATMTTITPEELNKLVQSAPAPVALFKKVPSPKKRPLGAWPRPDDMEFRDVIGKSPDDECDAVINSGIIVAERIPALGRWGACYVPHAVRVNAIMLMGRQRVDIVPPAKLRCGMALAVANWVRGEVAPAAASLGAKFVGIRQLDSYNCRSMSSSKRVMSEHSAGNALDVADIILANHQSAGLYSRATQKLFRSKLKAAACRRFKTVLGPGVPQHHDHIHIDLRHHNSGNGICHWNVL
jgi:hypothetical protein